jgi:hypothetical protein
MARRPIDNESAFCSRTAGDETGKLLVLTNDVDRLLEFLPGALRAAWKFPFP